MLIINAPCAQKEFPYTHTHAHAEQADRQTFNTHTHVQSTLAYLCCVFCVAAFTLPFPFELDMLNAVGFARSLARLMTAIILQ